MLIHCAQICLIGVKTRLRAPRSKSRSNSTASAVGGARPASLSGTAKPASNKSVKRLDAVGRLTAERQDRENAILLINPKV